MDKRGAQRWAMRAGAILLGAALLCLPAVLNGAPFLFPDSDAYYSIGRNIVGKAPHTQGDATPVSSTEADAPAGASSAKPLQVTTIRSRSPFYGVVAYVLSLGAGLWGIVLVQALIASAVLWRLAFAFESERDVVAFAGLLVIATALTTLPWYVSFFMPDVWIGLPTMLLIALLFGPRAPSLVDYIALLALTTAAAAFHNSTFLILALTAVVAPLVAWWAGIATSRRRFCAAALAGGVVAAFAASMALGLLAERHYGAHLRMPIFLSSRVLADGPGRSYLHQACAANPNAYTLCRFSTLPLDDQDEIMWSPDPSVGVWTASDYDTRLALADEQTRFVGAAFLADPLRQAAISAGHGVRVFAMVGLLEFTTNYWTLFASSDYWRSLAIHDANQAQARRCLADPQSCRPPPLNFVADLVVQITFAGALVLLSWRFVRRRAWRAARGNPERVALAAAVFVIIILAANAFVCGALAGDNERFQARVAWILPILAVLLATPWREVLADEKFSRPVGR